tara:strand:- start:673 stop:942 length:270 start_codon:yes stop_codon:yes gene_type:complete
MKSITKLLVLITVLVVSVSFEITAEGNFKEESAILKLPTGNIYGTLLLPKNKSVVLIIAGSGPTDRNGNQPNLPINQGLTKEIVEFVKL